MVGALALAKTAHASPLFELSGDTIGQGGFNARVVDSGAACAYFNPAFLPDTESGLSLAVYTISDQIGIHLNGRPSASNDILDGTQSAQMPGGGGYPSVSIPTDWLQNGKPASAPDDPLKSRPRQGAGSGQNVRAYQAIGLVQKLFNGRVGIGLYAMVPYSKFTGASAFFSDEREQYFSNSLHPELYSDRLTATSLAFGSGLKITDQLNFGVAFTLSLKTVAKSPTYLVDVGRIKDILIDTDVSVAASVAPHFAVLYKPFEGLRLSLTVHTPQKFEVGTNFSFFLSNGIEQGADLHFTHAYLPWTIGTGGSWDAWKHENKKIELAATILYARWSDYIDRHSENPSGAYAWYDTISGSVGARYNVDQTRALLDLAVQPSPVPTQSGRTNYVDNTRIGANLGLDHGFEVFGSILRIGIHAQAHRLLPRTTTKLPVPDSPNGTPTSPELVRDEVPDNAVLSNMPDSAKQGLQTNNPGYPGYSSEGWVLGGGLSLAIVVK